MATASPARHQPFRLGRPRRTRVDFLVPYLKVPVAWTVGRVTFRPPGWLERRVSHEVANAENTWPGTLEPLAGSPWSSASVWTVRRHGEVSHVDEQREQVRDAIALARLYQRACVPTFDMDHQTFGLPPDIEGTAEHHWRSDYRGHAGGGWSRVGVGAAFEFRRDWVRSFRSRPAFAFLDDSLRGPAPPPGSWPQRAITAIRTLNLASPSRPQPVRIVLQAVALEALLGDDPPAKPGEFRSQAHPVAQRAAFLTCDRPDGARLKRGDAPCNYLLAKDAGDVTVDPNWRRRPRDYWDWPCTWYWHIREVFDARNRALHDAQDAFRRGTAVRFEGRVDQVLLDTLDWVVATGATCIGDVDRAVKALPVAQ